MVTHYYDTWLFPIVFDDGDGDDGDGEKEHDQNDWDEEGIFR